MKREIATGFIAENTVPQRARLVPEIELMLASDSHLIFSAAENMGMPAGDRYPPYWAFAWPGGQALARYLLDNPGLVKGRRIADIGSGSGIAAIAAAKAGAAYVLASDVDPVAKAAIELNAARNDCAAVIDATTDDVLDGIPDVALVVIADLVYEPELALRVGAFLERAVRAGTPVLVGDRLTAKRPAAGFDEIVRYPAPLTPALTDLDDEVGRIWRSRARRPRASGRNSSKGT